MINKRKKIITIAGFLVLVCGLTITVFLYFHSRIYWKYDDSWMLGKERKTIEKRYGRFDRRLDDDSEAYLIKDSPYALIYDGDKGYLVMDFDKNGRCVKVYQYTLSASNWGVI